MNFPLMTDDELQLKQKMYDSFDLESGKKHFISAEGLAAVFEVDIKTMKKILYFSQDIPRKPTIVKGTLLKKAGYYYLIPYFKKFMFPKLKEIYYRNELDKRNFSEKVTFSLYYLYNNIEGMPSNKS